MKINEKFCFLTPDFPKMAYIPVAHIIHLVFPELADNKSYLPLEILTSSLIDPIPGMNQLEKHLQNEGDLKLDKICTLMPLYFESLIPLRREFWGGPGLNYNHKHRYVSLMRSFVDSEFYKIMVTGFFEQNNWIFYPAVSYYVNAQAGDTEKFFFDADWAVDERSKYAAFYTIGNPLRFNWKTGEVSKIPKKINLHY